MISTKSSHANSNYDYKPTDLEKFTLTKNWIVGSGQYCNNRIPKSFQYVSDITLLFSKVFNVKTEKYEYYAIDLSTYGRGVVDRRLSADFRLLHPVESSGATSNQIYKLENKDCLTFGSETKDKYKIRLENGRFVTSDGQKDAMDETIIAHTFGTIPQVSIPVPEGTKNVDSLHALIIGYLNNGQREWGITGLSDQGNEYTHIRRNGLIEPLNPYKDLEKDEIKAGNEFGDYKYKLFKLKHMDEILLNGVKSKDFKDAYVFKFLEKLDGKK